MGFTPQNEFHTQVKVQINKQKVCKIMKLPKKLVNGTKGKKTKVENPDFYTISVPNVVLRLRQPTRGEFISTESFITFITRWCKKLSPSRFDKDARDKGI